MIAGRNVNIFNNIANIFFAPACLSQIEGRGYCEILQRKTAGSAGKPFIRNGFRNLFLRNGDIGDDEETECADAQEKQDKKYKSGKRHDFKESLLFIPLTMYKITGEG